MTRIVSAFAASVLDVFLRPPLHASPAHLPPPDPLLPAFAASVFDVFLGPQPLDNQGRLDVGFGLTWAANGYR